MSQHDIVLEELRERLSEQVRECVEEMGRARGRADASRLSPQLSAVQRGHLYLVSTATGSLAAELSEMGLLELAKLFAPNAAGYWWKYQVHTVGMLLTEQDADMLTSVRRDVSDLAYQLQEVCSLALTHGWEEGFRDELAKGKVRALTAV